MAILSEITNYLSDLLSIKSIGDYPQALNGLHLENNGSVSRIAAAVDACEAVLVEATRRNVDLLLVHHGLFWNTTPFTGGMYRKMKAAIQGNLAVYSAHLPLDVHPLYGNNALLANAIGLNNLQPFLQSKGQPVGIMGQCTVSRGALLQNLASVLGSPVHFCPGGPDMPKCVGVITGGAGSEVEKVAAAGVDTFITGEGPHWSYTLAEELGINLFYGGHYATETLGVKSLAAHLSAQFDMPWEYIPHPTGL